MEKITINSPVTLEGAIEILREVYANDHYLTLSYEIGKQRTPKQRAALEVYCRLVSEELNAGGFDMVTVLKEGAEIPWVQETVKDRLWRPVQEVLIGTDKTSKAERSDYRAVYETLSRHLSQRFGISIPWPEKKERENE